MDEKQLARDLEREGFRHTYVWQDGPHASYADHTHGTETAHIILNGEMTLTMKGESHTYREANGATWLPARCTPRGWGRVAAGISSVSDRTALVGAPLPPIFHKC